MKIILFIFKYMNNFNQHTFYFNVLKTNNVDNYLINVLNNNDWNEKNIVINFQMYVVYFIVYNNRLFIKPINNYNTEIFKQIFNFNFINWFCTDKIVEIVEYK
jgi:hypothetical protein